MHFFITVGTWTLLPPANEGNVFTGVSQSFCPWQGGYAWPQVPFGGVGIPGPRSFLRGEYARSQVPSGWWVCQVHPQRKVHPLEGRYNLEGTCGMCWHLVVATAAGGTHPTGMLSCLHCAVNLELFQERYHDQDFIISQQNKSKSSKDCKQFFPWYCVLKWKIRGGSVCCPISLKHHYWASWDKSAEVRRETRLLRNSVHVIPKERSQMFIIPCVSFLWDIKLVMCRCAPRLYFPHRSNMSIEYSFVQTSCTKEKDHIIAFQPISHWLAPNLLIKLDCK